MAVKDIYELTNISILSDNEIDDRSIRDNNFVISPREGHIDFEEIKCTFPVSLKNFANMVIGTKTIDVGTMDIEI